jgi:hypothetical protein
LPESGCRLHVRKQFRDLKADLGINNIRQARATRRFLGAERDGL